jgi:N6-adenosine-specific RNA methylase IME4
VTEYRCIVVDPPWPQKGGGPLVGRMGFGDATGASKAMPYKTLTVDDIAAMPIGQLAHPDGCHLYLWTTNGFLEDAFRVVRAWGFTYSTTLVWAKRPMGGGLGGDYGISTEYVIYARRGRLPALSRMRGTWFTWKRPYDSRGKPMHSAKPEGFYLMAEGVSPGPRLDVFARRSRMGWDAWGDEAPGAVLLDCMGGAL